MTNYIVYISIALSTAVLSKPVERVSVEGRESEQEKRLFGLRWAVNTGRLQRPNAVTAALKALLFSRLLAACASGIRHGTDEVCINILKS